MDEKLKLHSKTVLLIVSSLLNPFFGGILLAQNLANTSRSNKIPFPLLFGGLFNLATSYIIRHFSLPILYAYIPLNLIGGIILITIVWSENMERGINYKAKSPLWPLAVVVSVWTIFFALNWYGSDTHQEKRKSTAELLKQLKNEEGANAGTGKFIISAPENWTVTDTIVQGVNVRYITAPTEEHVEYRATISVISAKSGDLSSDDYFLASIKTMKKYVQDFVEEQKGQNEIHGIPAKWITYSYVTEHGTKIEAILYLIMNKEIVYSITGVTSLGDLKKYQPTFEKVVNSFTMQ